jgi:hypothetical protein
VREAVKQKFIDEAVGELSRLRKYSDDLSKAILVFRRFVKHKLWQAATVALIYESFEEPPPPTGRNRWGFVPSHKWNPKAYWEYEERKESFCEQYNNKPTPKMLAALREAGLWYKLENNTDVRLLLGDDYPEYDNIPYLINSPKRPT